MDIKNFIAAFAETIEVEDVDSLTPETEFRDLEEWSSLSIMYLILFFDEEFEKQIGDKEIKAARTIQDLYNIAIA